MSTSATAPTPPAASSSFTDDPVTAFANDVRLGRIVLGRLARRACERHLRDLETGPARGLVWHLPSALYAIRFFAFCRHSKGRLARRPIELAPWQQFIVGSVFGWKRADGTRRFRTVYEEVPRKNGKSTKLSAIGLLGLVADGETGAEVYSTATKLDQAKIIFNEARRMVLSSPELRRKLQVFKSVLTCEDTFSKFEPLGADSETLDGLNPHVVLVDELHRHRTRDLFDVLDTALGAREQPLIWIITTAGDDNPESVYAQENAYATQVLDDLVEDDDYFAIIFTIDEGDRWDDPETWKKANPGYGISVRPDDLERQARKARKSPAARAAFLRLRLNVRSAAGKGIARDTWKRNTEGPIDVASLHGLDCHLAIDVSSKIDIAALVAVFPPKEAAERWKVLCKFFVPGENVAERAGRDRAPYRRWIDERWIVETAGDLVDQAEIEAAAIEWHRLFRLHSCSYDPWNAAYLATRLTDAGLPVVQFDQTMKNYNAPCKELEELLVGDKLDHGGNPVLAWMSSNLRMIEDTKENKMPSKKHSTGRIDGMTGLLMGLGMARRLEGDANAWWNDPNARFFGGAPAGGGSNEPARPSPPLAG